MATDPIGTVAAILTLLTATSVLILATGGVIVALLLTYSAIAAPFRSTPPPAPRPETRAEWAWRVTARPLPRIPNTVQRGRIA